MKTVKNLTWALAAILCIALLAPCAEPAYAQTTSSQAPEHQHVKKILFIGDSMTGWLAEALNGYGRENGFEVATVVWDGSTIQKWANSPRFKQLVETNDPDAVFVSLGMNDLFTTKPESLAPYITKIKNAVGNRGLVWVGPPSWPGHNKGSLLNNWLSNELGSPHYFNSFNLSLPRQSAKNPHPTREGMIKWIDALAQWLPTGSDLNFPKLKTPSSQNRMVRGKTFIYKRMKEQL